MHIFIKQNQWELNKKDLPIWESTHVNLQYSLKWKEGMHVVLFTYDLQIEPMV